MNELDICKLLFINTLRKLLDPFIVDEDMIIKLLMTLGGDCWRDSSVADLLEERL